MKGVAPMADPRTISHQALDEYRDERWHRTSQLRVTDDARAARFVEEVPCCLAFGGYSLGVPTLWVAACGERKPLFPKHSHHDRAVGLVWGAKETLVEAGVAYYGRLFLRKPSFVARAWFPTVIAAHPEASLSPQADAVVNVLRQTGPISTEEVGQRTGITDRKALTDALSEAQGALEVVKTEERHDPFTYVWGTLDELFAQDLREAEGIPPAIARRKLVRLWVNVCGAVPVRKLASVLAWPQAMVEEAAAPLVRAGAILTGVPVEGQTGTSLVDAEVYGRLVR